MADELVALGGALLAAGLLARLGRRIGLPTIPLFMIAGVIFGPNTPGIALVDDPHDLELLAAFGLILLLFHLGLEFSLVDLAAGGSRLLAVGGINLVMKVGGGLLFGFVLGWGGREALVIGGAIAISSSAIVTKLLVELRRLANPETRLILGIVVVEDIFLAVYLAILQPVFGDAQGFVSGAIEFLSALGFLVALAAVARWGTTLIGKLIATPDDELLTVCFVGIAMLVAGAAEELGLSAAIGAFMAGIILAESPVAERVERLVLPLRDVFASVFFFSFGLAIDPGDAGEVLGPVVAAVVLTLVMTVAAGLLAARFHRYSRRAAANIAFTTLGRGEFSLILATLAATAGLDHRITPFVALYVLALAIAGPALAARTRAIARLIPPRLVPDVPRSTDVTASVPSPERSPEPR